MSHDCWAGLIPAPCGESGVARVIVSGSLVGQCSDLGHSRLAVRGEPRLGGTLEILGSGPGLPEY